VSRVSGQQLPVPDPDGRLDAGVPDVLRPLERCRGDRLLPGHRRIVGIIMGCDRGGARPRVALVTGLGASFGLGPGGLPGPGLVEGLRSPSGGAAPVLVPEQRVRLHLGPPLEFGLELVFGGEGFGPPAVPGRLPGALGGRRLLLLLLGLGLPGLLGLLRGGLGGGEAVHLLGGSCRTGDRLHLGFHGDVSLPIN